MSPKLASFLVLLVLVIVQGADEVLGSSCSERMDNLEKAIAAVNESLDALKSQAAAKKRCESGQEYVSLHNKAVKLDYSENPGMHPAGAKGVNRHVNFSTPFTSVPVVMVGLSSMDVDHTQNMRIITTAINLQKDGFDIIASEWLYTKVYFAIVSWIACSD